MPGLTPRGYSGGRPITGLGRLGRRSVIVNFVRSHFPCYTTAPLRVYSRVYPV